MAQPIAPDYGQQFLFPPALEDWVPKDHPARFLREFVDELHLDELGFAMPTAVEGRPPYAPSLLLKIWLYGYFHHIRSTRKLEKACREHLPLVWLAGLIQPDHNSLWRFWRDNRQALREVFKKTVQVALRSGCVGLVLQAVDGTKIEAAASGPTGWRKEYMEKLLAQLDAALTDLEIKVVAENAVVTPEVSLPTGLAQRQALREEIKKGLAQLAADGREHYHPVEPEARRMKLGNGTNRFGYNAQVVADAQAGIIVACEVTRQESDAGQLVKMIDQSRENVGTLVPPAMTLADGGYGNAADIQVAAERQIPVLVPPLEGTSVRNHPYARRHFHYDVQEQTVTCPRGQKLDHEGRTTKRGQVVERYRCHCRNCPVRALCTGDPKGRQIEVWPHAAAVQAMQQRLSEPGAQRCWQLRGQIIERRFAQLKQHDGFRRWTVWGLESVRAQWSLLCTTLNLRILYKQWKGRPNPGAGGCLAQIATTPVIWRLLFVKVVGCRAWLREILRLACQLLNQSSNLTYLC